MVNHKKIEQTKLGTVVRVPLMTAVAFGAHLISVAALAYYATDSLLIALTVTAGLGILNAYVIGRVASVVGQAAAELAADHIIKSLIGETNKARQEQGK